jgi:hypothetical protein
MPIPIAGHFQLLRSQADSVLLDSRTVSKLLKERQDPNPWSIANRIRHIVIGSLASNHPARSSDWVKVYECYTENGYVLSFAGKRDREH